MYSLGEKGPGDEGERAAVGSVHAGTMRPLELEALVAQNWSHRSVPLHRRGGVLQAAARPSLPPLPFEYKGERGSKMN